MTVLTVNTVFNSGRISESTMKCRDSWVGQNGAMVAKGEVGKQRIYA